MPNHNKLHDEMVKKLRAQLKKKGRMTLHLKSYTVRRIGGRIIRIPLKIEKGWPDVISFGAGASVRFFEVKTGENARLSRDQRERISALREMGFNVIIVMGPSAPKETLCKGR